MRRLAGVCSVLFSTICACGDDGGHNTLPDAPVGSDATSDANITGSVNIVAKSRAYSAATPNAPIQNVLVVALDKAGALVGSAMTDAEGKATLTGVADGGSVTAVYPNATSVRAIVTYVSVKHGDTLTFGDSYFAATATGQEGSVAISWTAVAGVDYYRLLSPCSPTGSYYAGTTTNASIDLDPSCQTATAPIVLKAYDGEGNVISSIRLPAAPYTPGAAIALTAGQWVPGVDFAVGITGLPSVANYVRFGVLDDYHGLSDDASHAVTLDANTSSYTFKTVDTTATAYAQIYRNGNYGSQFSYKRGAAPTLAVPTLPWIGGLIANASSAAWLQSTGSSYDAAVLRLRWNQDLGKFRQNWAWTIVLPPGLSSFAFPTPPAQLADILPDDSVYVSSDLTFVDLASVADYDAVRALPEYRVTDAPNAVVRGDEPSVTSAVADGGEGSGFVTAP